MDVMVIMLDEKPVIMHGYEKDDHIVIRGKSKSGVDNQVEIVVSEVSRVINGKLDNMLFATNSIPSAYDDEAWDSIWKSAESMSYPFY
ncbi:hypothetical protein [Providencia rettgeri]|uniref:hypothetical protein n=1 Tax=Providencia rettgeri TaxID=587 RepID=UPI0039F51ACC